VWCAAAHTGKWVSSPEKRTGEHIVSPPLRGSPAPLFHKEGVPPPPPKRENKTPPAGFFRGKPPTKNWGFRGQLFEAEGDPLFKNRLCLPKVIFPPELPKVSARETALLGQSHLKAKMIPGGNFNKNNPLSGIKG